MTAQAWVWTASVADGGEPLDAWLTPAERARLDRFLHVAHRQAHGAAQALLRWALATHARVPSPRQRMR